METIERVLTDAERVAELKKRFTDLGIASFTTSGMDEYESLLSYLRAKDSFRFAFVRDPYARSKNMIWRLFKLDIWAPKLPMGYYGCPGFTFDFMGEDPVGEAVKILLMKMSNKYRTRRIDAERVSFKVVDEMDRAVLSDDQREFLKARNFGNITWGKA